MQDGPVDQVIFATDLVRVGAFRCQPYHPSFRDSGPAQNSCFVFSRTAVEIHPHRGPAFVASPNVVTFHNPGQPYQRRLVSRQGDFCDWFGVHPQLVRDAIAAIDPSVKDQAEHPFPDTHGRSDSATYLLQRTMFLRLLSGRITDPLAVEESVINLLARVIRASRPLHARRAPIQENPRQRELVRHAEVILSADPRERLTLQAVADELSASAFHLCRLFHRLTGTTLQRYRLRYRLCAALEAVTESARSLTDIALDAGFTSHSHFTESFRREFGIPPSGVRNNLIAPHVPLRVSQGRVPR